MATLIAFHEVEDGDHRVRAWHGTPGSRQEMSGLIGATARIFRDPQHPSLRGPIFEVPDVNRFQAFMATEIRTWRTDDAMDIRIIYCDT